MENNVMVSRYKCYLFILRVEASPGPPAGPSLLPGSSRIEGVSARGLVL